MSGDEGTYAGVGSELSEMLNHQYAVSVAAGALIGAAQDAIVNGVIVDTSECTASVLEQELATLHTAVGNVSADMALIAGDLVDLNNWSSTDAF